MANLIKESDVDDCANSVIFPARKKKYARKIILN
jgi:hypothetical protein